MARNDSNPLRAIPTKTAHELFPLREMLRLPKQSAMNSKLPKRKVLPREKPLQVKCSLSVVMTIIDE
jgi:hypothetical protein